jgi:hypothetical protein
MPTGKRRGRRDGKMGDLSPRIRRHIHRILSAALVRAIEQQPVARNPCDAFRRRLPKVERMEMTTLTTEPAQRLLDVIQHRRIYLLARSDRACHRYAARREPGSSIWPRSRGCSISINPVNATIARHYGRSRCSNHFCARSTAAAPVPKRTPTPSQASSRAPLAKRPRAEYLWRRRPRSSADRAPVS